VKNVGNSLATIAATDIQSQIDRYKDQIANLEEKKIVTESASEALIELWDKRIEEKRNSIKALEDKLHSLESRPKALNYDNAAS
jgi:glutamate racemase